MYWLVDENIVIGGLQEPNPLIPLGAMLSIYQYSVYENFIVDNYRE